MIPSQDILVELIQGGSSNTLKELLQGYKKDQTKVLVLIQMIKKQ